MNDLANIQVQDNSIAIIDCREGTAGQVHAWFEQSGEYHVACFVNPRDVPFDIDPSKIQRDARQFSYPTKTSYKNVPLINSSMWCEDLKRLGINKILVTTDEPHERLAQIQLARLHNLTLINAIHPSALIMADVILGDNLIIYPKVYIGYRAEVFSGTYIEAGAQLDHHNVIRECVSINPGVILAGNVTVNRFTYLHTGAIVKNRIVIGENSIVGAGTVIIKDVPANVTIAGVPGKIVKRHESHEIVS